MILRGAYTLSVAFYYLVFILIASWNFTVSAEDQATIVLPLKIHIVQESSGVFQSFRTEANAKQLIRHANRLWKPAGIVLEIETISKTKIAHTVMESALNGNPLPLRALPEFDPAKINVFLARSIGVNGLALVGQQAVIVSDTTTVNDFRTTAHEIGHLLGLGHADNIHHLMFRGSNGEVLTQKEILAARQNASKFKK